MTRLASVPRSLVGAACLLLVAACGSTVQVPWSALDGTGGLSGPDGTNPLAAPDTVAGAPPSSAGTTAGVTSSSQRNPGTSTELPDSGSARAGSSSPVGDGRGDSPSGSKTMTVGVITSGDVGSYAGSLGLSLDFGDQRQQAKALANYLNKRGGIGNRKVELVFYDYDASATADINGQAACSAFTEDHKAFAAVGLAGMADNYHACASQRGLIVVSDSDFKSGRFFEKYSNLFLVSDLNLTRKYAGVVDALFAQGFFSAGAKIGVLYADEPNDRQAVNEGMVPALKRHGLTPSEMIAINISDNGTYSSQLANAALKFKTERITHVLYGTPAAWVFMSNAQSAQYFPYHGLESRQSPGLLMQGVAPRDQLLKSVGVGFQPVQDVDERRDPGPVSSRQTLCAKIMNEAGQGWGTNRLAMAASLYLCDELFFLRDVLARPEAATGSFERGVEALGSGYPSTLTFRTAFGRGRHDGATHYRDLKFRGDCDCFVYTSGLKAFR